MQACPKRCEACPGYGLNLISAGKLDNAGLMNYFGEGKWKLTKGSLVMARGKKE